MFKRLRFWLLRKRLGYPSQQEIREIVMLSVPKSSVVARTSMRYAIDGYSLEEVAARFHMTRERTRQILWKVWRSHHVDRDV